MLNRLRTNVAYIAPALPLLIMVTVASCSLYKSLDRENFDSNALSGAPAAPTPSPSPSPAPAASDNSISPASLDDHEFCKNWIPAEAIATGLHANSSASVQSHLTCGWQVQGSPVERLDCEPIQQISHQSASSEESTLSFNESKHAMVLKIHRLSQSRLWPSVQCEFTLSIASVSRADQETVITMSKSLMELLVLRLQQL